ncbi:MAG TPA: TIGR04086 family membrane protein [Candidatus Onthoplasma faecipullorum]|nr:TIGR04086 family membrane protein [Candidatus Onthoplasma faecipullorum]
MQKLKSINWSGFLSILKCCLIGIVVTLIGIVFFAIVLKFADLNSTVITAVNNIIKALAIFFMVFFLKKSGNGKLIVKALVAGLIYAVLSFLIFSIMNGGFVFNLSILYDLLFALIVSVIAAVILNLTSKKA